MANAIWTDAARADLRGIAWYIVDRDQRRRVARKVTREIREKCDHYARHPHTGTSRAELGEGCRLGSHSRWVILFRPLNDGIEVLRIFDGAQDYESLL
jgi:toxin ParE1/3/4